jgi:lysophospholipase L1-like esterase
MTLISPILSPASALAAPSRPCSFLASLALALALGVAATLPAQDAPAAKSPPSPARWEAAIKKFEAADQAAPPPKGAILLVGGSNARRWPDVGHYFPGETVLNRGFGGALLLDVLAFTDRIVLPYAPKLIILNAGGNDLAAGRTPEQVRDACRDFITKVRAALPAVKIYAVAIPPTVRSSKSESAMAIGRRANALLQELAATGRLDAFIDIVPSFLDASGQPRLELYVEDGTHFTPQGHQILADLIHAAMKR